MKNGRDFWEMIQNQWSRENFVCVGLDSEFDKIPQCAWRGNHELDIDIANTMVAFNRGIIETTCDLACAYKINPAFYLEHGADGIAALKRTIANIHAIARDVPIIFDGKYGDVEHSNVKYARFTFDQLQADAVTVNPYLGICSLRPFYERKEKGVFVIVSYNYGIDNLHTDIARHIACGNSKNCGIVINAIDPRWIKIYREKIDLYGNTIILIPGIGAQGGNLEQSVAAGLNNNGEGIIVSASRNIIFASNGRDFAKAAWRATIKLRDSINQYRNQHRLAQKGGAR